jgi:hypothetical protein
MTLWTWDDLVGIGNHRADCDQRREHSRCEDAKTGAWFSIGVGQAAGAIAKSLTGNVVKQFVIKKGMESAVKIAAKKALGND